MSSEAEFRSFAALKAGTPIVPFSYKPLPLADDDVEIKIDACGVCHSDLHQQNNDWGMANYPLVPGHEIIGRVVAMGPKVTGLRIGQRVGVGPQVGCCEQCQWCKAGKTTYCKQQKHNYGSPTGDPRQPFTFGGFSEKTRCPAKWAFPIPDGLDTVNAAPLMCAGQTTWGPLMHHGVKSGDVVGIIGIGGLGHIAIQFASALGCNTTAISTSANKKDETMKLGAKHFLNISDPEQVKSRIGTFDFILSTISAEGVDWTTYLSLLKPEGKLCSVGAPKKIEFNPMPLIFGHISISGSLLAPKAEVVRMLQFAADHKIQAMTEVLPMNAQNCNEALKRIEKNAARYRMVLVQPDGEK